MMQMLPTGKQYSIAILKAGPKRNEPGAEKIIREHGRRNFSLRTDSLSVITTI